jgi:voltage-gated potassium channel
MLTGKPKRKGDHSPEERLRVLLSILALAILASSLGYWLLDPREDANFLDAVYMTFITIATVGYKEVFPLTDSGKLFTVFVIASSGVILALTIGTLGQFFVEGELRRILGRRKMDKQIKRMKEHFIVAGCGRVGQIVIEELERAEASYVIVEKETEKYPEMADERYLYVEGDATEDEVLIEAGIEKAKCLIITIPSEADAVYIALTARQLNPGIFTIARADSKTARKKLERAGADRVVMPHDIGGRRMAQASLKPSLVDSLSIDSFGGELGLEIEEVKIPSSCSFVDKTLFDSEMRSKYGVTVMAIRKKDGQKIVNPPPEVVIEAGDVLVLVAEKGRLEGLDIIASES